MNKQLHSTFFNNTAGQNIKQKVSRKFNRAAAEYEKTAVLQRIVAERLIERLELISITPQMILDLGSGSGAAARHLRRKYSSSKIIQTDIAINMLLEARKSSPRFFSKQYYVCSDAESLPFKQGKVDMVYSNLMLQWCDEIDQTFTGLRWALKTNGLFIFSSFGPDTLKELRECWAHVDDQPHVNTFIDMHDLGDALIRAGFESPVMETEYFTLTYEDVHGLIRELKLIGANSIKADRRRTLTGKTRFLEMVRAYENRRQEGRIPATYEVIYGHAWAGQARAVAGMDTGEIKIPASAIKRRT